MAGVRGRSPRVDAGCGGWVGGNRPSPPAAWCILYGPHEVHKWQPRSSRTRARQRSPVFDNAIRLLARGTRLKHVVETCKAHMQASEAQCDQLAAQCARLGGRAITNADRDFMHMIFTEFGDDLVEPYHIWLPLLDSSNSTTWDWTQVPVLLMCEFLDSLHGAGHIQQHVSLLGEDGIEGVRAFWREARKCEALRALCDAAKPDSIPLLIHYDGIGTFRNFEHDVWSFSSAMIPGGPAAG